MSRRRSRHLQSDVTAGEEKKVCQNDLAASVVKAISSAAGGCEQVISDQLKEIASFEVTIRSIQITSPGRAARAMVKSKYSGKDKVTTISLAKEGAKWKIAKLS